MISFEFLNSFDAYSNAKPSNFTISKMNSFEFFNSFDAKYNTL